MPYRIQKRGPKWHVVNADTGEDKGGSDSEDMAHKHMAAMYANEPAEPKTIRTYFGKRKR